MSDHSTTASKINAERIGPMLIWCHHNKVVVFILSAICFFGLVSLLWLPLLPSVTAVPKERVSALLTAVGQVLIAYLLSILAVYSTTAGAIDQRRERWQRQGEFSKDQREADVLKKLDAELDSLRSNIYNPSEVKRLSHMHEADGSTKEEFAEAAFEAAKAALDNLEKVFFDDTRKSSQNECILLLKYLCYYRRRQCYSFYGARLHSHEESLNGGFVIAMACSFWNCVLCFWPDPLLADTLPHVPLIGRHVSQLGLVMPSGVYIVFVFATFAGMVLFGGLFLQLVIRTSRIGRDLEVS